MNYNYLNYIFQIYVNIPMHAHEMLNAKIVNYFQ